MRVLRLRNSQFERLHGVLLLPLELTRPPVRERNRDWENILVRMLIIPRIARNLLQNPLRLLLLAPLLLNSFAHRIGLENIPEIPLRRCRDSIIINLHSVLILLELPQQPSRADAIHDNARILSSLPVRLSRPSVTDMLFSTVGVLLILLTILGRTSYTAICFQFCY